MIKEEAFEFLRQNQPLPDDSGLSEEMVSRYNEIRLFFTENPDEDAVPLLLNSFGAGDGFGVYQLIEDVVGPHSSEVVVPYLVKALSSAVGSARYWCAQIAARFPSPDLIEPLGKLLRDDDYDVRYAAVTALEQIPGQKSSDILKRAFDVEQDEELKDLIREVLESRSTH